MAWLIGWLKPEICSWMMVGSWCQILSNTNVHSLEMIILMIIKYLFGTRFMEYPWKLWSNGFLVNQWWELWILLSLWVILPNFWSLIYKVLVMSRLMISLVNLEYHPYLNNNQLNQLLPMVYVFGLKHNLTKENKKYKLKPHHGVRLHDGLIWPFMLTNFGK